MAQPDGYYPRLNAVMLNSGQFTNMIVSVVGQVRGTEGINCVLFQCADGGTIRLNTEHGEFPPDLAVNHSIVEVVGQASGPDEVMVRHVLYI